MTVQDASRPHTAPQGGADVLGDLVQARVDGDPSRCHRAEDAVVVRFLSVATSVAHRYRHRGVDSDDLEQVARLGLVKAVRRWRSERGSFLPYAVPTVEGEVKRYFRDNGSTIRIPRALYEAQPRVTAAVRQLWQENSQDPKPSDIADRAGIPEQRVRDVQSVVSACRPLSTDADTPLEQPRSVLADREIAMVELRARLRPALSTLSDRERKILVLRFIWDQSQVQIAASLGVSQMQVSRLLRAALDKLRDRVGEWQDFTDEPEPEGD